MTRRTKFGVEPVCLSMGFTDSGIRIVGGDQQAWKGRVVRVVNCTTILVLTRAACAPPPDLTWVETYNEVLIFVDFR